MTSHYRTSRGVNGYACIMKKIDGIHTFEDEAFLARIARASFAVMLAAAAVCAAWWVCSLLPGSPVPAFELASLVHAPSKLGWLLALAAGVLVSLVAHEAVHAAVFKLFAPKGSRITFGANWRCGMLFACADGIVYTRRQYLAIVLAPTLVVTLALVAAGALVSWPLWTLVVVALHLSGCVGDWAYAAHIAADPAIAYCEDTEWGVQFYGVGEDGRDEDVDAGEGAA